MILEDVYGCSSDDGLRAAVSALTGAVDAYMEDDIAAQFEADCHPYAEVEPVSGRLYVEIAAMTYDAEDKRFVIRGTVDADGSSSVGVDDATSDSGIGSRHGDAVGAGAFTVGVWPEDDDSDTSPRHC